MMRTFLLFFLGCFFIQGFSQSTPYEDKFRQLEDYELPTPNIYRNAAGSPGHEYWQQKADYDMEIILDDLNQRIYGTETITYHNQSPDKLSYLWLQLDQNMRAQDSERSLVRTESLEDKMSFSSLERMISDFDGGFKIDFVKDAEGNILPYTINQTMMRVDLPVAIEPGGSYSFQVKWWYNINDRMKLGGRSGYEYFPEEDNYLYTIAQFFPRMCVYNEVEGWQNKQFLGRGEFTLTFGDYKVALTVPADHIVASTGLWQNPKEVLTEDQRKRLVKAEASDKPVMIVTPEEALSNEASRTDQTQTWVYYAENVRDFAFASSRKFIWDAQGVRFGDRTVLAMSYYPKEGNPLWEQYSTKAVAHTLDVFSRYTFDYPYPVAISVHTDRIGMEYPMICFNGGRPEPDGTYTERTKYGLTGVIIHEVGHNYFPMIVNSDERQWTWMDEGLNTFLQYLTEVEWERDYPVRRGPPEKIVDYMKGPKEGMVPVMTNSESIKQFGNNAYAKVATSLNILRETVMGRELFDFAFKEYANRWMFKQPTPADFFRTMEDASAVDLDWFWRGWYYTTDHVDIALEGVNWYKIDSRNPDLENSLASAEEKDRRPNISYIRNQEDIEETLEERDPSVRDFYNDYDPYETNILDREDYQEYLDSLESDEKGLLNNELNYYELKLRNKGGLVMPVILEFTYDDGEVELIRIPAEIWRLNSDSVSKVFSTPKEVVNIVLDPYRETADTDTNNNYWPPRPQPTRFQLYKSKKKENPMQRAAKAEEAELHGGSPK